MLQWKPQNTFYDSKAFYSEKYLRCLQKCPAGVQNPPPISHPTTQRSPLPDLPCHRFQVPLLQGSGDAKQQPSLLSVHSTNPQQPKACRTNFLHPSSRCQHAPTQPLPHLLPHFLVLLCWLQLSVLSLTAAMNQISLLYSQCQEENIHFSIIKYGASCRFFLQVPFMRLKKFPCTPTLLKVFIMNVCWIFPMFYFFE